MTELKTKIKTTGHLESLIGRACVFAYCLVSLLAAATTPVTPLGVLIPIATMFCLCFMPELCAGNGDKIDIRHYLAWLIPAGVVASFGAFVYAMLFIKENFGGLGVFVFWTLCVVAQVLTAKPSIKAKKLRRN